MLEGVVHVLFGEHGPRADDEFGSAGKLTNSVEHAWRVHRELDATKPSAYRSFHRRCGKIRMGCPQYCDGALFPECFQKLLCGSHGI